MKRIISHIIGVTAFMAALCFVTLCFVTLSASAQGRARIPDGGGRTQTHRNFVESPRKVNPNAEKKILVIMGEYLDQSFFYSKEKFQNMLTQESYSVEGATGSAKEYLQKQLGGTVTIDIVGPVKVSGLRQYYGENNSLGYDSHPATFVAQVCTLADSLVNFAEYDCDKDGFVDNLFVFYAGEDESQQPTVDGVRQNTSYMWSHSSSLESGDYGKTLELDGVKINRYACTSEIFLRYSSSTAKSYMAPIGTFVHELMHSFGLADMYDTDYAKSGGTAAGLWQKTCLMDAGNYNNNGNTPPNLNALERERLGLMKFEELKEGKYVISPVGSADAKAYRVSHASDSTDFYVLECRYSGGTTTWDKYIGGTGLLLYHVDRGASRQSISETYGDVSSLDRWNKYNEVNARPDHQCADLVEADGRTDLNPSSSSLADIASIFFPQTGSKTIGGSSSIPLVFWDETKSNLYIYNITDCGDGTVSFYVRDSSSPVPPIPDTPPEEMDMLYIIVQNDGVKMKLSVNNQVGASVKWTFDGEPIADVEDFRPTKSGTVKAVITWSDGSEDNLYKTVVK